LKNIFKNYLKKKVEKIEVVLGMGGAGVEVKTKAPSHDENKKL
jgi:hypothetical protein